MLLIPHSGDTVASGAAAAAYQFQIPWSSAQAELHTGTIPAVYSAVRWSGKTAAFSSLKMNGDSEDLLIRWFNMVNQPCELQLDTAFAAGGFYQSDVLEAGAEWLDRGHTPALKLQLGGNEIMTIGIRPA
jgi:alpha-mannosidase